MKLRMVDPNTIKIPEERVTARMSQETAEQFENSIREIGIDEPIKVFEVDGELYLSDGLHRVVAAIHAKIPKVPVTVRPGTMIDVVANNLMSGHLRGKHPVSEMRRSINTLYRDYQLTIEDIVKKTGLTQAYVEKLLIVSELTPLVLEALDNDQIGIGQAFALTKIKSPSQQEVVFQQLQTYHWTVKALEDYIEMVLAEPAPAPPVTGPIEPAPRALVPCQFCKQKFEPERLASVIVCQGCSHIMYEAIAVARAAGETTPAPGPGAGPPQ